MKEFALHKLSKEFALHKLSTVSVGGCITVLLIVMQAWHTTARSGSERIEAVSFVGDEQIVYNWYTDRCADQDIPDTPPRAFRDYHGDVHLFSTHEQNRALIGSDFEHLQHACSIVYQGAHSDDPSQYNDRQWLTSFTTANGRQIHALVHNEFQGNRRKQACPSGRYLSCWYNAITYASSDDGGYSFKQESPPRNLVAIPFYRYPGEIGRPVGYFQPTNMVEQHGYFYFLFLAAEFGPQPRGLCVARTNDPSDARSWRGWSGSDFEVEFLDPYLSTAFDPAEHVCSPVRGRLFEIGSLSVDIRTGLFLMLTSISDGNGNSRFAAGPYLSTSKDLLNWSEPIDVNPDSQGYLDPNYRFGFFSLIDESSRSLDFSTISSEPSLFLYYVKMSKIDPPLGRILVKRRVKFSVR